MRGPQQRMQPGMSGAGGSANFNERTGMNNPVAGRSTQVMQAPPGAQTMMPQQGQIEPAFQQQPQQQFGLAGAEQSMLAGQGAGISALEQGQLGALNTLGMGQNIAQQNLAQGRSALSGNFSGSAVNVDPMTGQPLFQQAAAGVGAFSPAGLQAQGLQSALSGAQGQQAFDQAFINSPVQQFVREQGEQSRINQAASTGGLGGGEVLKELTRFGQGNAGLQLQQQIQNLGSLSNQGLQAAGQQGQFLSQAGQQQGNLANQNAQRGTQVSMSNAANRLGAAQGQANLFGQGAGISSALAGQGAGIQSGLGQQAANIFTNTGQNIGQGRLQAGRDIGNQISNTTSQLSNLTSQQGGGLSDIIGQGSSNLANLLSGSGQMNAAQSQQLAQLLSNLAVGQGGQLSNAQNAIGQAQAGGQLGRAGAIGGTIGDVATGLGSGGISTAVDFLGGLF